MQMADMQETRTLSQPIPRPASLVYEFIAEPTNLSRWAAGLGSGIALIDGAWTARTPQGPVVIRFIERNAYGVLDHHVRLSSGVEIYVPMRVVANGAGCEVLFTVYRQPDMSDEAFDADIAAVRRDLRALASVSAAMPDAPP